MSRHGKPGSRSPWAGYGPGTVRVDEPFIRGLVAFGLNFWSGTAKQNEPHRKNPQKAILRRQGRRRRRAEIDWLARSDGPITKAGPSPSREKPGPRSATTPPSPWPGAAATRRAWISWEEMLGEAGVGCGNLRFRETRRRDSRTRQRSIERPTGTRAGRSVNCMERSQVHAHAFVAA